MQILWQQKIEQQLSGNKRGKGNCHFQIIHNFFLGKTGNSVGDLGYFFLGQACITSNDPSNVNGFTVDSDRTDVFIAIVVGLVGVVVVQS